MNFRLTLAMVFILLLISTLFFWNRTRELNVKPGDEATKNAVFTPQPKDISSITYTEDGDKQLAFTKSGTAWTMTYPTTGAANAWSVDPIADGLKTLSYKEKFDPEASGVHSAASTGTDSPHHVITFTDDAGKEHTLDLGKASIGGIYATIDGGKSIYLLQSNPLDGLQQDPTSFRDRNIKQSPAEKITGLTIKHADQSVSLTKSGDKWLIDAPISTRANHSTVDEIINEMKDIRAFGFSDLAKTMPATGLNPPVVSVTALVEDQTPPLAASAPASQPAVTKTPVTLELGYYTDLTNKNAVYASLAGTTNVFTVSAETFTKLNRQLKDLRDPAVTPAPVANATAIDISSNNGASGTVMLKKDNNAWQITNLPHPLAADTSEISSLLTNIANLRAINFVDNAGDLKSIGLDPPQAAITLTIPGQSQRETILVGKPEAADNVTPMMRQGEPTVFLVQAAEAGKITPPLISLRDKTVDKLPADSIRHISISGPAAPSGGLTLDRNGSIWSVLQNGKTEKADDIKITSLLGDFTPLNAAKYLAGDAKDEWHLPATPDLTVTITTLENTPAPTTFAATLPSSLTTKTAGPNLARNVTHTLQLYKDKTNGWKAVWEGGGEPQWLFAPTSDLIAHVTNTAYAVPATQPAIPTPPPVQ